MKTEEEVPAPRTPRGAGEVKKKKARKKTHVHIGPNARAFRAGLAFCPSCDAEKIVRLTEREKDMAKAVSKENQHLERAIKAVRR